MKSKHRATSASRSATTAQARRKNLSIPLEQWPDADRRVWIAACQPPARLKRGGAAGHLKPVTREDHERHYGDFLGFLDRRGLLPRDVAAAANVTPENVDAYLAELKHRVSSVTVHAAISKLRQTARYLDPSLDLAWLAEIAMDLAAEMRLRSKFDRLVLSEVLVEAGLTLIEEAELSQSMTPRVQAIQVRDGLMIALLAFCPIRRKNFAALEIGRSFVTIRGRWWIVLPASETKERRPDERPVDPLLNPFIERYLDRYRPVLARSNQPSASLWLGAKTDRRIVDKHVAGIIRKRTLTTVGIAVSPHMFRTAGASAAAVYGGKDPHLGTALLNHSGSRVTQEHYNRATSIFAAEKFRQAIRQHVKT